MQAILFMWWLCQLDFAGMFNWLTNLYNIFRNEHGEVIIKLAIGMLISRIMETDDLKYHNFVL